MTDDQNQRWGDWRAMVHEHKKASYAMLAALRDRALKTLGCMTPAPPPATSIYDLNPTVVKVILEKLLVIHVLFDILDLV